MASKPIITSRGILSYPSLFAMKTNQQGKSRYETTLLLPLRSTLTGKELVDYDRFIAELKAAVEGEIATKWPKRPTGLKLPLLDQGDAEGNSRGAGYVPGAYRISANTTKPIEVVGHDLRVLEPAQADEAYPGRWAKLVVVASSYAVDTARGVKLYLNGVQLLEKGPRLAGAPPASKVFAQYDLPEETAEGDANQEW